jgi:aspartate/methionine/tyrosine aminotransferase
VEVNRWAADVPASGIREIVDKVAGRTGIAHLEMGQPDFPTPQHIIEAGVASVRQGSGYTHSAGTPALRDAIAAHLVAQGIPADPPQVIVTQGGVQGCSLLLSALVTPGDEVLIPDPAWPNFAMLAGLHGAVAVPYALHRADRYQPDPDEVARLITPRTRLLIINSPSNPTGGVFELGVVERLVEIARRAGVVVLTDEVYDALIFDGTPARAVRLDPDVVIGLYSFSKTYAMTGWRVGYVLAPPWLAPTLAKIQEPLLSCIPTMTQAGALAAVTGPQECIAEMLAAYRRRRDLIVDVLRGGGIDVDPPAGAFYLVVPLHPGADSRAAALDLIDHGVAVSPGTAYGSADPAYLRVSLASSDDDCHTGSRRIVDWFTATDGGSNLEPARSAPVAGTH